MALPKLFQRIFFHNNTTPSINEDNFNAMSKGLSDVDDRVIGLAGTIMEDVPQIQEDIEELEADMALIDTKIASVTAEANRATTAANNAAASVISAGNKALVSEGWAKGTQNGIAVGSSSPYYHNNAEYFKNQARSFTPEGYQDLVDNVDSLKETLTNFEESITGEVVDSEPYVLRQGLGNLADMSLVGGSIAWNQLIQNGNFANTDNWVITNSTGNASNNKLTLTATGDSLQLFQSPSGMTMPEGKKIFMTCTVTASVAKSVQLRLSQNDPIGNHRTKTVSLAANTRTVISAVFSPSVALSNVRFSLFVQSSASGETYTVENFMAIDLTALFGSSTIADYIYSLEQATAGAGVAWFRKYFPNAYYGYNAGSMLSVNPSKRKVVGKNLIELFFQTKTINGITFVNNGNGTFTLSGTASANTNIRVDQAVNGDVVNPKAYLPGKYALSKNSDKIRLTIMQDRTYESVAAIGLSDYTGIKTVSKYFDNCFAYISIDSGTSFNNETFWIQAELGETPTAFEPYQSSTYTFDSSKQLRGIPKLVDNKLSYDGDIYTADETVTRKYTALSFDGDEAWRSGTALSNVYRMAFDISPLATNSVKEISNYLPYVNNYVLDEEHFYIYNNVLYVFLKVTNETEFKAALASKPLTVIYELATPTTESANAYQNPQRAFIDGTEEFIDAGVTASTRDVSIPVGNNTTYQLNETLPPTEDYVDGALKFKAAISALGTDESGRTTASRAYTTGEFFYKDRKMYKVLTSIAQGATFTINTNCQQTTLFAELKALAQ